MPEYRRHFQPGGTFFFTVVTHQRHPIFITISARALLGDAFRAAKSRYPFTVSAICLLPDHLHCIWTLPETESNNVIRWSYIKSYFTHQFKENGLLPVSKSRENRREGSVWQRRFWEHVLYDELDLNGILITFITIR